MALSTAIQGSGRFDVAVIGAGVVGCAVARRFALAGARVAVIEKGADILSGASKANSAILHTGFDAPPASLELELIRAGRDEYLAIRDTLNLPLVRTGALVCAWSEAEAGKIEGIAEQGRANGIARLALLTGAGARATMPSLSNRLVAALEIADEHVIDPWSAPLAYLTQAVALGAEFLRDTELLGGAFDGAWTLATTSGALTAQAVVNAAGLYGDVVDARLGFDAAFTIKPRKGQFVVLDKAAAPLVPRIVLPVPTEVTKGVVVCPTAFGNVLVGPTAEEQEDRDRAAVDTETLRALIRRGAEIVPGLKGMPVTAVYAGLRPATQSKAYQVLVRPEKRAITLGGIRSTGLSAALGLAAHAFRLHERFGLSFAAPPPNPPPVAVPSLAETQPRDWRAPDHGEIVCHCELVTKREIEAALNSPIPPGDFGGLRRRTRAGMGRCQGFYCGARLAELSKGRLTPPLGLELRAAP